MNYFLQTDDRACFRGMGVAAGSTMDYRISDHFKKLDVKKTKYSTITVK